MKEMTVYNILSSLEPEQEEQAFYSLWGRGDERKTAPDAAVCFGVPTIPSFPVRPSDPPPPTLCGAPSSLPAVRILVTGVDEDTGIP